MSKAEFFAAKDRMHAAVAQIASTLESPMISRATGQTRPGGDATPFYAAVARELDALTERLGSLRQSTVETGDRP